MTLMDYLMHASDPLEVNFSEINLNVYIRIFLFNSHRNHFQLAL